MTSHPDLTTPAPARNGLDGKQPTVAQTPGLGCAICRQQNEAGSGGVDK